MSFGEQLFDNLKYFGYRKKRELALLKVMKNGYLDRLRKFPIQM